MSLMTKNWETRHQCVEREQRPAGLRCRLGIGGQAKRGRDVPRVVDGVHTGIDSADDLDVGELFVTIAIEQRQRITRRPIHDVAAPRSARGQQGDWKRFGEPVHQLVVVEIQHRQ